MAGEPRPGLFHLPLNVNDATPLPAIQARIDSISSVLKEDYGALHLAANNLLGLLHFYAKLRKDAQSCFEKVLTADPHNLNALANLKHMFETRKMKKKEEEYEKLLIEALTCSPEEHRLRMARCRAEQAYCIGFECLKNPESDIDRYRRSTTQFKQAIDEVTTGGLNNETKKNGEWTVSSEVAEWKFCQVWNWKRIYNHTYKQRQWERPGIFHDVLSLLCELKEDLRGKEGLMEAQVYTYIAYFFWKKPEQTLRPETEQLITEHELKQYLTDPESCFQRAMEIFSLSSDVTSQYACYIMYREEGRYEQAIEDLTTVYKKYSSWFARSKRGETYKKWYLDQCQDKNRPEPDKQLLVKAKEDFEEIMKRNPSSFVLSHLGETCILLETDRSGENMVDGGDLDEAVDFLQEAEKYGVADHGKRYRLLARCYRLMGEEDEELRALKRSVETTEESNRSLDNAKRLLYLLLLRYKKKKNEIPPGANVEVYTKAKSAFIDVFYWMVTFCFKHFREVNVMNKHVQELIGGNEDVFADIRSVLSPLRNESEKLERLDGILDEAKVNVEPQEPLWDLKGHGLCALPPPDTPRCKDFEYDFFVLHAEGEEERWVSWRLFPVLEDIHKEGRLKGFHMKRDSKPNETDFRNLEIAIQNSRKIIMVLSPAFSKCPFLGHLKDMSLCHVLEKRQAGLDKVIVPVIFENCEVPESLAYLRALDISNAIDDSDVLHIRKAVES